MIACQRSFATATTCLPVRELRRWPAQQPTPQDGVGRTTQKESRGIHSAGTYIGSYDGWMAETGSEPYAATWTDVKRGRPCAMTTLPVM